LGTSSDENTCETLKRFSEGDLIKKTPAGAGAYSEYWETYRVEKVNCFSLQIQPLTNVFPSDYHDNSTSQPPTTTDGNRIPQGRMLCDIEIIESGRTNQVGATVGNLVTYGIDELVIEDDSELLVLDQSIQLPNEYMYLGEKRRTGTSSSKMLERKTFLQNLTNRVIEHVQMGFEYQTYDLLVPEGQILDKNDECSDVSNNTIEIINERDPQYY
jgi:hypothetical protein